MEEHIREQQESEGEKEKKRNRVVVKYAESESIDVEGIRNDKLKDISLGCSVLIN